MELEMESLNTPVVSLTSHKMNSQAKIELDGVRRTLSMLPWDLQTQQVLAFAGLTTSETLLAETVQLAPNSHAQQLGHMTLQDLACKPEQEDGLALDWRDFSAKLTALVYRQKFAIQERDFKEINALVDDAATILGRKPVDVGEFHSAKQRALQDQLVQVQREANVRAQDLQDKNSTLMRSLTEAQAEIAGLHESSKAMMQDAADRISNMTREMAMNQEIFERRSQERVQEEVARLELELKGQLERKQNELALQVRDADNKRMLAESRLTEIQLRIDRGELVSAELVAEAERRLEEARSAETALRNQLLDLNSAFTEAQKIIQGLRDSNGELSTKLEQLTQHTTHLEERIRDIIEDKLGSSEFAVLQERLSIKSEEKNRLEAQLEALRATSTKQDRALNELRGRFQQMRQVGREHFKLLNDKLTTAHERNLSLTQSVNQSRLVIGVLCTATIASTALVVLKFSGIM
jgi:hypothetical protein